MMAFLQATEPQAIPSIWSELLQQGLLGVVALMLVTAVLHLHRQNQRLTAEVISEERRRAADAMDQLNDRLEREAQSREAEAASRQQLAEALSNMTASNATVTRVLERTVQVLESVERQLEQRPPARRS